MIPDTGFINLDHLTHRPLVTHRCSSILEEAVNPESAKDSVRYPSSMPFWHIMRKMGLTAGSPCSDAFPVRRSSDPAIAIGRPLVDQASNPAAFRRRGEPAG